jgi:hypothetical protein
MLTYMCTHTCCCLKQAGIEESGEEVRTRICSGESPAVATASTGSSSDDQQAAQAAAAAATAAAAADSAAKFVPTDDWLQHVQQQFAVNLDTVMRLIQYLGPKVSC